MNNKVCGLHLIGVATVTVTKLLILGINSLNMHVDAFQICATLIIIKE